jgi:hypothetical protein
MKNNLIIGVFIALVIGGGIGFFAGMQYQKSKLTDMITFNGRGIMNDQRQANRQFTQRMGGPNSGNRPVTGEIIDSDDKSITVKLSDGSSKIIIIDSKTSINKSAEGSLADLKKGEKVAAFGISNSDGSINAVNIQLNPQIRVFNPSVTPEK